MNPDPLLLLLVGVPPTPSSLRVRVWRRLRSLGAVPLSEWTTFRLTGDALAKLGSAYAAR